MRARGPAAVVVAVGGQGVRLEPKEVTGQERTRPPAKRRRLAGGDAANRRSLASPSALRVCTDGEQEGGDEAETRRDAMLPSSARPPPPTHSSSYPTHLAPVRHCFST